MSARLRDGDRVCIIGGGPGGSFAALHLLEHAARRNLHLETLIFEPRDPASRVGPRHCKGCAGILSDGALRSMAALGLEVPPDVIQSTLRSYVIHLYGQVTTVSQPDPTRHIYSVYRGSGPRLHEGPPLHSFDGYLLGAACARGAQHIPARVRAVENHGKPVVHVEGREYPADLVVLASGVNSRPPLDPSFGYRTPPTLPMVQDEVLRPDNWPEGKVAGFFGQPPGLIFGAVVPKGRYLNVSLLWHRAETGTVEQFYRAQVEALQRFFPRGPESLCGCNPRIVVDRAPVFYGDRWVAVGDAVVSRLYKDGIHSALLTAGRAVQTAIERGVSAADFAAGYAPFCRQIEADNRYGFLMYNISALLLRLAPLARAWFRRVGAEAGQPESQRIQSRVLWGLLTGDESYRDLFRLVMNPRGLMGVANELRTKRRVA